MKRLGEKKAIIAVARKLLVYVYNIITTQMPYDKQLDTADTERINAKKLESAKQQVSMLERKASEPKAVDGVGAQAADLDGKTAKRNSGSKSKRQKSPFSSLDDLYRAVAANIDDRPEEQGVESVADSDEDVGIPKKKRGRPKKNPVL